MNELLFQDLNNNITLIDTGMIRQGLAALYLMGSQDEYALIETGTHHSIPAIMSLLGERGVRPEQVRFVIPTHVHLDHAGGVGGLMQLLPQATLLVHPSGARHMIDPAKLKAGSIAVYGETLFREIYGDVIPVDASRVRQMQDTEQVVLGSRTLVFYDTPGHARHHFCVHDLQSNGIFTGDTFGLAYPTLVTENGPFLFPTTTPVQFDPDALRTSVRRLMSLQAERMYLTHYGMVENPQSLGSLLLEQIDDYVEIAQSIEREVSRVHLENTLRSRLTQYTIQRARAHGVVLEDRMLEDILEMDMRLNSQGLSVWLG